MDQNFRKRLQKTLYCGELESEHCPLALTELAVEYFHDLAPHRLGYVDLQSASAVVSQDSVSPSSMAMSMMYAERLRRKRPDYIRQISSSDLFLISMMMASKYLYDEGVDEEVLNDEWAEKASIDKEEVNSLELDFLDAMEWEMHVKKEDFDQTISTIEKSIALREGLKRGWFSYTDLCLLLDDAWHLSVSDVGFEWLQVMFVSSAAYFVGALTMVGSTVLVTSASSALASSGFLPAPLAGLYASPSALLPLVSSAALCPQPVKEYPGEISYLNCTGTPTNDTEDGAEERETKEPLTEHHQQLLLPGRSMLDTILSQLMAVLTLKSHLVQFVYAVSDSYTSSRNRNHSAKEDPTQDTGNCMESIADTQLFCNDGISHELEIEILSAALDHSGLCSFCGKQKMPHVMNSDVLLPGSGSQQCQTLWCHKCEMTRPRFYHYDRDGAETQSDIHRCLWRAEPQLLDKHCREVTLMSSYSLFSDIPVGFSTSMPPPVYAT